MVQIMSTATQSATVSVPEAADRLGISRSNAYALVRKGIFPVRVIRVGRLVRVSAAELDATLGVTVPS
jgi:excisionase family DNA binding protein